MKEMLHGQIASMKEFFERSSRALEEGDSEFAPKPELFTVSQIVAHTAQTIDWFMEGAFAPEGFGMDFDAMDKEVRSVKSLKEAREWFNKACDSAAKVIDAHSDAEWGGKLAEGPIMGGMPRVAVFGALTDHSAHHRGALTVYTRLLGKVPPMPYMEM